MAKKPTSSPAVASDVAMLEKLFAPNKVPKGEVRLLMSLSDGSVAVRCMASGRGCGFRKSSDEDLFQFVKAKDAETRKWIEDKNASQLKENSKGSAD